MPNPYKTMSLISIIEEAEKEFDEKFDVGGFNNILERASPKEFKDFNRQLLLKLVEGIEEELKKIYQNAKEDHICRFNDGEQNCECYYTALNEVLSFLQPLKDKLKQ